MFCLYLFVCVCCFRVFHFLVQARGFELEEFPRLKEAFRIAKCTYISKNIIPSGIKVTTKLTPQNCTCQPVAPHGKKCFFRSGCINYDLSIECPNTCGAACGNQVNTFLIFYIFLSYFLMPNNLLVYRHFVAQLNLTNLKLSMKWASRAMDQLLRCPFQMMILLLNTLARLYALAIKCKTDIFIIIKSNKKK